MSAVGPKWNVSGAHAVPGNAEPAAWRLHNMAVGGMALAELKAVPFRARVNGLTVRASDGSSWVWDSASELDADDVLVAQADDSTSGRWLLAPGYVTLRLPIAHSTVDGAVLLVVPDGAVFAPQEFYWSVTAGFTGGTASAIGVSASVGTHSTAGDLLGGATGDVAATLVAGAVVPGTIGAVWASVANRRLVLQAGDEIQFDRITSAFTAGTGFVIVTGVLLANAGA